jgi:serine/threonine-protein kinase
VDRPEDSQPSNASRSFTLDALRQVDLSTRFDMRVLLIESSVTITQGAAVGTPAYMSPEQVGGLPVDQRSDVFSLAAIAYRVLTGRPAFTGPDHLAIMYRVHNQQPRRPSLLADVHQDVDLAFALGLAKDREQRFHSALELSEALAAAAKGRLSSSLRVRAQAILAERGWRSGADDASTLDETRPS